jgi:hypothetical protein
MAVQTNADRFSNAALALLLAPLAGVALWACSTPAEAEKIWGNVINTLLVELGVRRFDQYQYATFEQIWEYALHISHLRELWCFLGGFVSSAHVIFWTLEWAKSSRKDSNV